jgi:hypothetical protein
VPADLGEPTSGAAPTAPDSATVHADRRVRAELLGRHVPDPVAARAVASELLASGWRPPPPTLTTVEQLHPCRRGRWSPIGTGRWGVRSPAANGASPTTRGGSTPDEPAEWAPPTRHTDDGRGDGADG